MHPTLYFDNWIRYPEQLRRKTRRGLRKEAKRLEAKEKIHGANAVKLYISLLKAPTEEIFRRRLGKWMLLRYRNRERVRQYLLRKRSLRFDIPPFEEDSDWAALQLAMACEGVGNGKKKRKPRKPR